MILIYCHPAPTVRRAVEGAVILSLSKDKTQEATLRQAQCDITDKKNY